MNSTGDFLIGGLLSGFGTAITKTADEKRVAALEALKREYAVEDRNYGAAADLAKVKEQGAQRVNEIAATGQANIATEKVKAAADAANIVLKGQVDLAHDKAVQALVHANKMTETQFEEGVKTEQQLKLDGVEIGHKEVNSQGQIVFFNKKGDIIRYSTGGAPYVPPNSNDSGDPIAAEAAARGGGGSSPAPAKASPTGAQNTVRQQALARLPGLYSQIEQNPDQYKSQYPGMFDANGNLLPISVLKDRINQRYGAQ